MKKKYCIILSIFLFSVTTINAQTTSGKEFYLTFGSIWNLPLQSSSSMQIRIVGGDTPTTGVIYFTNLNESVTFSVGTYEVYTYSLNLSQRQAVYNLAMGVTDYSIHITSNEPVTVYALHMYTQIGDATNILPVTALGREYYQISYTPPIAWYLISDAYAVVATQNNTEVFHNGDLVATLNAGQVYYRTAALETDMTGDHITTTHPVAFFALNQGSRIPFESIETASSLTQQLAPVNTWGEEFFVPASHVFPDIVRIVASQNNTNITETDGTIRLGVQGAKESFNDLQAGDFVELEISNTGCYIKVDKPVEVCSYLRGVMFTTVPAQCWIPTLKQTVSYAQVAPFISTISANYLTHHYALVCTSTHNKESTMVSIGGAPPTALTGGWTDNTTAQMSFYSIPLDNDTSSYIFTNPAGLIIFCYGSNNTIYGTASSYYYLAGSAMRELDAAFYANEVHFQDLKDTTFCAQVVNFRAEMENMGIEADTIKWYVNGVEETTKRDSLEWNKSFPVGEYSIKMWVRFENNDTLSKKGILKIKECDFETAFYANNVHSDTLQNVTFCEKTVNFQAEIEGEWVSIKWYLNGVEETTASNQETWSKEFGPGEHIGIPVIMEVIFTNNEPVTIESALNVRVFWTQIKNIRR